MDRILERHEDVGTLGVYLYEKNSVLYIDKLCTKEATVEDAHYAFLRRGVVVLENGGMAEITSFSENESATKSITYGASASSDGEGSGVVLYSKNLQNSDYKVLYKDRECTQRVMHADCEELLPKVSWVVDLNLLSGGYNTSVGSKPVSYGVDTTNPYSFRTYLIVMIPGIQSGMVTGSNTVTLFINDEDTDPE